MRILVVVCLLYSAVLSAEIRLPYLISDGMVLQRDQELKLWGWEAPNTTVSLGFEGKIYTCTSNEMGEWTIPLQAHASGGPFQLVFYGSDTVSVQNVLFGDVWLCSGQSNMELMMDRVKYKYPEVIRDADNPQIRQFEVPDRYNFQGPKQDLEAGAWKAVDSENINKFSAVAYFFAEDLYAKYHIPIGLINASLGGSPAQAWMSEEALISFPEDYKELQKFKDDNWVKGIEVADENRAKAWFTMLNDTDLGLKQNWRQPTYDDSTWDEMEIPGFWADGKLGNKNGVVWFRKTFEVSEDFGMENLILELGRIVDADSVFLNGAYIGSTGYQYPPRLYKFSSDLLKRGKNDLAVRVINQSGKGGFVLDKKYQLRSSTDTIQLLGIYKYRLGCEMKSLDPPTFIRWKPAGLYNSMISPLTKFSIKGVLWYQGESNTKKPEEYKALMTGLIANWRSAWDMGEFPFILVQLANFMEATTEPTESDWAELRDQQFKTLSVPNTGLAVAIDLGEWNDIHPLNKKEVGRRLSLQAQKLAYDESKGVFSGPLPKGAVLKGEKAIVSFTSVGQGLMIPDGGKPASFELAGADRKFVKASAILKGDQIILSSVDVKNPMYVRYAWANNPVEANLYNQANLPSTPFEIQIGELTK